MDEEKIKEPEKVDELQECRQKCDEYLNNWKRERADFLNYKKEEVARIGMLAMYTKEETIEKMLPILDSFYLAEKQLPEKLKSGQEGTSQAIEWTKGFLQIKNQISEFLKKEGIEEIEAIGQKFNAETMEIVSEEASGNLQLASGTVVEELRKGYKISEKVLRPAKVRIAK